MADLTVPAAFIEQIVASWGRETRWELTTEAGNTFVATRGVVEEPVVDVDDEGRFVEKDPLQHDVVVFEYIPEG